MKSWCTQDVILGEEICRYAVIACPCSKLHCCSDDSYIPLAERTLLRLYIYPVWKLLHLLSCSYEIQIETWANGQRDGRPAEYRWHPMFNAAKSGWRPLLQCREVTLPRRETLWNLQGCLKLANASQPLVGRSSPYCEDMWGRHCCLTSLFFRLSIRAFVVKI